VGKALDDAIVAEDQPQVTVGGGGGAVKGVPVTFSAAVTNPPQNVSAPQRIYWDMGDGTVLSGQPGQPSPSVTHVYRDAGNYTVSVCVSWEPGVDPPGDLSEIVKRPTFAATGARQITVGSGNSTLVIEGPQGAVGPGEVATFRVNVSGFFGGEVEQFLWNFGDGSPPAATNPQNYVVEHVYYSEGDFDVTCTLKDSAGSTRTVTTSVSVSLAPVAPLVRVPRGQPLAPPPDAPNSGEDIERLELKVVGHRADSDALEIKHDGRTVYDGNKLDSGSAVSSVVSSEPGDVTRPSVEYIRIDRLTYVDGEIGIPGETEIILEGEQPQMLVRMRHLKPGAPPRSFSFTIVYDENELFEGNAVFRIKWGELAAITAATLPNIFEPGGAYTLEESNIERWDDRAPSLNFSNEEATDRLNISAADDTKPENATANIDDTQLVVGLPGPPVSIDDGAAVNESLEGLPSLDGTQVYQAVTRSATTDAPPGLVVASDAQQNPRTPDKDDCPIEIKPLTITEIEAIQNAVRSVFLEAGQSAFFKQFIFSFNDLWILEQGSGALLWKSTDQSSSAAIRKVSLDKLRGVYVKGKSDNDYEIFLPVFKKTSRQLDPENQDLFEAFPRLAHQPEYMTGDWYFRRPRGLTANGDDLGPPPDPDDREAFQRYVAASATWRYDTLGVGAPEIDTLELWSGSIPKGHKPFGEEKSVFDQPATPAEVISHILTHLVKSDPERRKILPDVSFFPFRREHLKFACLSLEKPPPFGDDPVGDAGMGRQLLLMKWLLEGAFLPPFGNFNAPASLPSGMRSTLFDRLKQRESLMAVEGYEWGLYQQWAILRDNAHFRVRPQGVNDAQAAAAIARARCREVFGNFLDKHDEKVMKKVGKAGIRAALARLAIDDI
jgi:PKD repeat protein